MPGHDQPLFAEHFCLLNPREGAGTLDPIIPPELLIDDVIPDTFAKVWVLDGPQERRLFGREVDAIRVVSQMRGAGETQFRSAQPVGDRREVHRMPIAIEVLVRKIVPAHPLKASHLLGDLWIARHKLRLDSQ